MMEERRRFWTYREEPGDMRVYRVQAIHIAGKMWQCVGAGFDNPFRIEGETLFEHKIDAKNTLLSHIQARIDALMGFVNQLEAVKERILR